MLYSARNQNILSIESSLLLQKQLKCSYAFSRILVSRGFDSQEKVIDFLLHSNITNDNPYLLTDMDKAIKFIINAISAKNKICVFGDYDVDGICASVIMIKVLKSLDADVCYYIPDRHREGFGMSRHAIDAIHSWGANLIITVDNGISANEEINYAYSLGIKVIVTDHHRYNELPCQAEAIVASSRDSYSERINDLSGAGVSWMISRALTGKYNEEYLPLVALAIAADSVNVTRLNRVYLKKAFPFIKNDIYLKKILQIANASDLEPSMYMLNFILAPRINAAGRMDHAYSAIKLFLSDNKEEIHSHAIHLEKLNAARKEEEHRIFEDCTRIIDSSLKQNVLVLFGEDWNTGVIGITASRLAEKYAKNVFVFSRNENGIYTGSGRSNGITDLFALISKCSNYLIRFGGHSGAAGLSVDDERKDLFSVAINEIYEKEFMPFEKKELSYDIEIAPEECTMGLIQEIESMSPFGPGNPEPVFRIPCAQISNVAIIGKTKEHLSATLTANFVSMRMIGFHYAFEINRISKYNYVDALVTLARSTYQGKNSVEYRYCYLKPEWEMPDDPDLIQLFNDFSNGLQYNKENAMEKFNKINEERLRQLFIILKTRFNENLIRPGLQTLGNLEEFAAILIFLELGFIRIQNGIPSFITNPRKRKCEESNLFSLLQ